MEGKFTGAQPTEGLATRRVRAARKVLPEEHAPPLSTSGGYVPLAARAGLDVVTRRGAGAHRDSLALEVALSMLAKRSVSP